MLNTLSSILSIILKVTLLVIALLAGGFIDIFDIDFLD